MPVKHNVSNVKRRIGESLCALGFILGLAACGIWVHDGYTKPQSPDTKLDRIYPLNLHGTIVYLNRQERVVLNGLQALAVLTFVGGVIMDVVSRTERR